MTIKLSQIPAAANPPALTDQFVGIAGSSTDNLFTGTQIKTMLVNAGLGGGAVSSVSNSDGSLTISPTTGAVVGSLNVNHANTWTASQTFLSGLNFSVGADATGDMYYRNSGGNLTRLPVGSSSQILTTSGGLPVWQSVGSGGTGNPGGANGALQINQLGSFGGIGSWNTAQGGLTFTMANPNANNDLNDVAGMRLNFAYDNSTGNPGFTNRNGLEIVLNGQYGQNTNGTAPSGTTNAKTTWLPFAVNGNYYGAGQKNLYNWTMTSYGMGDTSLGQYQVSFAGGPVNGDEGQALSLFSRLHQITTLYRGTITSVTRSSIAAGITVTQVVTGSVNQQTVTVSATTGIVANDWLCIGQEVMNGSLNMSDIKVISVGVGTITAVILNNYNNGATLGAALVLQLNDATGMGQQRFVVNETRPAVTAGTVSSISGGGFTGTGTSWSTGMVGGNTLNVGAICLAADYYTSPPFAGAGASGTPGCTGLDTWYLITTVVSSTLLAIWSFSVAADQAYHGYGPGSGGYTIRQSARILRNAGGNLIICEPSTSTWNVNDVLLCPVCAYPDMSGRIEQSDIYTAGGIRRAWLDVQNAGARAWGTGILIEGSQMTSGSNSDRPVGWQTGIELDNCITGLSINTVPSGSIPSIYPQQSAAINVNGVSTSGRTGRIAWGPNNSNPYIEVVQANSGLSMYWCYSGFGGLMTSTAPNSGLNPDTNLCELEWQGWLRLCGQGNVKDPFIKFGGNSPSLPDVNSTIRINSNLGALHSPLTGAQYSLDFISYDGSGNQFNMLSLGNSSPLLGTGWAAIPPVGTSVSNVTNKNSALFGLIVSLWNGSAAVQRAVQFVATPGSGINNAPLTFRLQFPDPNNGWGTTIDTITSNDSGQFFFGNSSGGTPYGPLNDPSQMTAVRTVTWPNVAGGNMVVVATGGVPLHNNSAGTAGTVAQDGTSVYICYAANSWVKFAGTFSF